MRTGDKQAQSTSFSGLGRWHDKLGPPAEKNKCYLFLNIRP